MKFQIPLLLVLFGLGAPCAHSQGTFVYDQQSSTDEFVPQYGSGGVMQQIQPPWGQSFTPSLFGVDFIRLKMDDGNLNDAAGASIYINLRANSISGPILGSTDPVAMPSLFAGNPTFFFPATVAVTPGVVYYFEPIVEAGSGNWNIISGPYNYAGGSRWAAGAPVLASDLWFREGLYVVPEPSSVLLLLLGSFVICWTAKRRFS
jgi:hypothetical protein